MPEPTHLRRGHEKRNGKTLKRLCLQLEESGGDQTYWRKEPVEDFKDMVAKGLDTVSMRAAYDWLEENNSIYKEYLEKHIPILLSVYYFLFVFSKSVFRQRLN